MKIRRYQVAVIAITLGLAIFGVTAETANLGHANGPIDPTCISTAPCIEYDNNGSGLAIRGVGLTGNGIGGVTKQNSTSASNAKAGMIGFDVSTSGTFDSGVKGVSTRGAGLTGLTSSGTGVIGTSTSGAGMQGNGGVAGVEGLGSTASSSIGVLAANLGSGLGFEAIDSHGSSLFTVDGFGNTTSIGSVTAGTNSSYGVQGTGVVGVVGNAVGSPSYGVQAYGNGYETLYLRDLGTGGILIDALDKPGFLRFRVDDLGNVYAHTFNATLLMTHQATSAGPEITTYANQSSTPTVEDFGEGQLVGGRAAVALERTFATTINRTAGYMVFITPEGDTRGLYVTQKSAVGFVVRENQGGRSTVAFSYRIVARPFSAPAARLPLAANPIRLAPPPLPQLPKMPAPRPDLVRSVQQGAGR